MDQTRPALEPPTSPDDSHRPADDTFVPFDLIPPETDAEDASGSGDPASRDGVLTGAVVIAGIVAVFVALLVLRPLG